jgi:lipopolysaccharide export system permease protein
MKIIYKSILKELTYTFILSLACLNFILMTEKLLKLSRILSGVGSSMFDMVKIILYLQPQLFLLTIPMSLLLSTLLVYGRHNVDNEIVILKSSGMNFRSISTPVFILGLCCFVLNMSVSFYLGPESSVRLQREIIRIIKERTPLAVEAGRFNDSFKDILIVVREKPTDNTMRGIFVYDSREKNEPRVMLAKEGKITTSQDGLDMNLFLEDGYINITKDDSTTDMFFKKYNMMLKLQTDTPARRNAELTPIEIIDIIRATDSQRALMYFVELYRRFTLPFLCIILSVFGTPLSMIAGKSGRLGGLTIGLTVFTVYYMLLIYGENLVRAGKIPHYIGSCTATVILTIVAFLMFRRENQR